MTVVSATVPTARGPDPGNEFYRGPCTWRMDIETDTGLVLAGVAISLVAALELYPLWRGTDDE